MGTIVVGGMAVKMADYFLKPDRLYRKRKLVRKSRRPRYGDFRNIGW